MRTTILAAMAAILLATPATAHMAPECHAIEAEAAKAATEGLPAVQIANAALAGASKNPSSHVNVVFALAAASEAIKTLGRIVGLSSELVGCMKKGTDSKAEMPAECQQKLHLAALSAKTVREAATRTLQASESMMILGNEMLLWNAETFDAERTGEVTNRMGADLQSFVLIAERHSKNTAAALDCVSSNWSND